MTNDYVRDLTFKKFCVEVERALVFLVFLNLAKKCHEFHKNKFHITLLKAALGL